MNIYSMTHSDLTSTANQVKETVIKSLMREGEITIEQGEKFLESHAVIVAEKGILGKLFDKALSKDVPIGGSFIICVRRIE